MVEREMEWYRVVGVDHAGPRNPGRKVRTL